MKRIPKLPERTKQGRSRRFKIPQSVIILVVIAFATFIMGGGVYDLLERPVSYLPGPTGGLITVYPSINEQTLNESVIAMSFYAFTFAGFILSYRSSQIRYNPRQFRMTLILGITLLIVGVIGCNYLIVLKTQ